MLVQSPQCALAVLTDGRAGVCSILVLTAPIILAVSTCGEGRHPVLLAHELKAAADAWL